MCEAYLGIWPTVDLWVRFFYLRQQTVDSAMVYCGAASIYFRPNEGFPKIPLTESMKKWQKTFFYVKNADPTNDRLNLPAFVNNVPAKLH